MNRNLLFTSLMLCCSVMAISQQAKHSCFTNNLIVGDSIRYDLVDIEKLCIPENDESTWDFSNLKYLGKEREESFYGKDSAKCMSAIRRFHSLRSFHPRLFTFAPFGDGRMLLAKLQLSNVILINIYCFQ